MSYFVTMCYRMWLKQKKEKEKKEKKEKMEMEMEQLSPVDMTGILNTNVIELRNSLLTIKGEAMLLREVPSPTLEMYEEAFQKIVEEIDKTLVLKVVV